MDINNRTTSINNVLQLHHGNIIQDIQGDVIMELFKQKVLTESEYQDIKSQINREEEASRLLELLPSKGIYGINHLLNYLEIYYSWIADPIQNSLINESNEAFQKKVEDVLTTGEVPQLPLRHVSRDEHIKQLKGLLKNLKVGNYVVVNGMAGCGKSSLVVEALNDPLITMHYFQGFVQWIYIGRENSSNVGCIQTEVLNRLNDQEQFISPPLTTDYEATRKKLKNLWKQKHLTDGLLVLDDVCSYTDPTFSTNQIVKYLDIGCKILIITHDKSIMDDIVDSRIKYLKVNEGFKERETLDLFSKCLKVDSKSLPKLASMIHYVCKGFPLTISLIGAQLETHPEESLNSSDRWAFYLDKLSDKSSEPFKHTPPSFRQFKSLENAIEMSIKSLPDDLQKKYQDFALFVDDINIKPEVLCVLWNLKKIQVEDIMSELIRKSLLVRIWNEPLKSYVYSIHDLLLTNLKKMMNKHESKELHKKLIECYRIHCNGNFAGLPKNDNYIFLYFGYHLKNADMLEEFPRWFLNLKFIESKICVTGPADLLADLKKYRKYIVVQDVYEEYIKEIEYFVMKIGPTLYQTKCDIVQLGLREQENSFVFNESNKIAKTSGKSYFFYYIRGTQNCFPEPQRSIVRDDIETIIFGNNHDQVLIATTSGSIKVWNIMSHKCLYTYNGHVKRVTHLVKNNSKTQFLSTSDDATIRIWNLKNFSESNDTITRTPSPETRQEYWQDLFQNKKILTETTNCVSILTGHSGPVIFAQFSPNGRSVVSCSTDKTLKIWRLDKDTIYKTIEQNSVISKCYFMNSAVDRILYSTQLETGSVVYGSEYPFDHCKGLLYLTNKLLSFFPLHSPDGDDTLLIMTPEKMQTYKLNWERSSRLLEYPQPIGYNLYKVSAISEEYTSTINKSQFVAFSLSNYTIKICDLSTGYNLLDINDSIHGILNLDWFLSKIDQCYWLLCAAKDKSIRLWCFNDFTQYSCICRTNTLHQSNNDLENVCKNEVILLQKYKLFMEEKKFYCYKLKQNFDALWLNNNSLIVAALSKCGKLKILLDGLDQWSISSMIDVKVVALSIVHSDRKLDQTMIIVACEDKSVHMLKYQTSKHLFDAGNEVDKIFACLDEGQLTIAMLLKKYSTVNKIWNQTLQIWSPRRDEELNIPQYCVKQFINCFVFHDKVILLSKIHELLVFDLNSGTCVLLEIPVKINRCLMVNHSELVVISHGNTLNLYKIFVNSNADESRYKLEDIGGKFECLPFSESELISISISTNKKLIVIAGLKIIVLIDIISKTTKYFTMDLIVNNIQSLIWSSDDTFLAIKDDNQIITFDVESGRRIASVRLTADKFFVDSTLKKYITVNTAGQLVMLNLSCDINI